MSARERKVLVSGCSDDGLGAALAIAFHKAGFHVYATARNPARMTQVRSAGIETITLDVLSDASIASCVDQIKSLDILVNNAGALYSMPVADISFTKAKELFDLNVWSMLAMSQAFLPLLLQSKGMIVNQTSSAGVLAIPFQGPYNASKAAMIMFNDIMRMEMAPFGVRVIDLRTSGVISNGFKNLRETTNPSLPRGSIYECARDTVEGTLRGDYFKPEVTAEQYATQVVGDLLKKNPPQTIWRGTQGGLLKFITCMPFAWILEGTMKKMTGIDVVEQKVRA